MQVNQDEITPGLVVRLDTTVLRTLGGSQTNAEHPADGDRAVAGTHDFLLVRVDAQTGICTSVPLFSKTAVGNQPLDDGMKAGRPDQWFGEKTYFSRWQHWRMPLTAVVAASAPDEATPETRRRYADADLTALDDILGWERRNRSAYRAVGG